MDKKDIKNFVITEMKALIDNVLSGNVDSVDLMFVRPADVIKYMEELGCKYNHDIDTNGWQWDYWINFKFNDKTYMLAGDGYYNDSATFELADDE